MFKNRHRLGILLVCVLGQGACEWGASNSVTITAEDFRFTPDLIQIRSDHPFNLILRNQGRERHVFQSPSIFGKEGFAAQLSFQEGIRQGDALILEPGKSLEMVLTLSSGVYPFRCWIKGHAGMEGTFLVSD